ncbi:DUF2218 domain-containing protein [Sinorhizobium sp. BG8]|uniref:DUF2218 domain-containing protein n=1 Tax=Sinorhizobium sp. BG8 TaxID=2613773 RepID=UPI00193D16EF|nr:DUF2218 domain-containing protein [Sinorhizobium sp. BG8]QRM57651.1 DUF2218 domain-containing protein [Sinorhizobium sp. BG8]
MNEQSPITPQILSVAKIETSNASRYLQQLCKHFAHKRPVSFDPNSGSISFTVGTCRLEASNDLLTISLESADDEQMVQLQDVVVRHLVRFAFREELHIDWQASTASDEN